MSEVTTELAMEANDKAMEIARLKAENAKLREEIEAAKHDLQVFSMGSVQLEAENAQLKERIVTQKQTIQAYRDESREWREEAEHAQAENAKLRELAKDMWPHVRHRSRMCGECKLSCDTSDECLLYEPMRQRMAELGVEVDA